MTRPSQPVVWAAGLAMVTIVSACSAVGVTTSSLITGPTYKIFITLFTGLAVGSLVGSSIFSLIPQAFGLYSDYSRAFLWKSLMIFGGIYLFYLTERALKTWEEFKRGELETEQQSSTAVSSTHTTITHKTGPSKRETEGDLTLNELSTSEHGSTNNEHMRTSNLGHEHDLVTTHGILTEALKKKESPLLERKIQPVAWMIIIGDGIHNFIDGLSMGAAFSESLSLGFTTSVAVIFEEVPHELGDFAVLIQGGMTVKEAVIWNFASACTCYLGLGLGIFFGNFVSSVPFIFALAGGMFLYISLVDMMGELNGILNDPSNSKNEKHILFLMQNIGILSGISIIFLLSYYGQG